MSDTKLVLNFDSTGAAKVAGDVKRVTEEVKRNTSAVEQQAQKAKIAGVEIDKFGSTLGVAGQAVSRLNSTAGAMVTTLGSATGAIQSLTTAGFGPLGLAVTAVNLAITAGVAIFESYSREAEKTKGKIDDLRRSLSELIGEQQRQASEAELLERVRSGRGTVAEQRGFAASAQQGLDRARLELQQLEGNAPTVASGEYGAFMVRRRELQSQILRSQQELRDAQQRVREAEENARLTEENARNLRSLRYEADVAEGEGAIGGGAARRGGGAARAASSRGGDLESLMSRMGARSPFQADANAFDEMLRQREEDERRAAEQAIEAQKQRDLEMYEARVAAEQKITDMLAEEEQRRLEAATAADEERIASYQNTASLIQSIGSSVAGVYGFVEDAARSSDESAEQQQKRELRRIAVDQGIQAVINAANAAAAFASGNIPGGIQFTAASALNAAAAAKAGVDIGNVRAPGGGGGAGPGRALGRDSASRASSEPTTIVVNMNGPTIATADRAELGRQLGRIVDEGRARYGA